jgi:hypothetical protein
MATLLRPFGSNREYFAPTGATRIAAFPSWARNTPTAGGPQTSSLRRNEANIGNDPGRDDEHDEWLE